MWALRRSDGFGLSEFFIVALTIAVALFATFMLYHLRGQATADATEAVMAPAPCGTCPLARPAGCCVTASPCSPSVGGEGPGT